METAWHAPFQPPCQQGLELLLRAYRYAEATGTDAWSFAIDRETLDRAGMDLSDLRWLNAAGFALHADEVTHPADSQRRFGPTGLASISRVSCFTLTPRGAKALQNILVSQAPSGPTDEQAHLDDKSTQWPTASKVLPDRIPRAQTPSWDGENRELRLGAIVIKRFRVPARNQELLLAAFQEQDWPHGIDDPLVPVPDQDSKERLKSAIRCLNRNQLAKLIRFRGNGNGMRIYWELIL